MSFSFSADLSDAISRVRQYLGDTVDAGHEVENETITAYLTAGRSELAAAAQLARDLASKYVKQIDSTVDGATQRASQIYQHYLALAQALTQQSAAETVQTAAVGTFAGVGVYGATAQEVIDGRCDPTAATNAPLRWR